MKQEKYKFTNKLAHEKSQYLLQYAHNPVNWYPWGDEALKKAQLENKLLIISIGYSACHWCHVMEHESFENEEIAQIMNDNFISVKVDREERPDVDHVYMQALQLLAGRGGWPLNCFALPDGKPVYAGTYFNALQWTKILNDLSNAFKFNKTEFDLAANELKSGVASINKIIPVQNNNDFSFPELQKFVEKAKTMLDFQEGGIDAVMKFPMPSHLNFFLEYFFYTNDTEIEKYLKLTLEKMANGGIFDTLRGGFARYSVDSFWQVPHFEKMLYDNAQLISVYAHAYKLFKIPFYKNIIDKTVDFCTNELKSDSDTFFAALDADSQGEEGKYYLWTKKQIDEILKENSQFFCKYFNVGDNGKHTLVRKYSDSEIAKLFNISETELFEIIENSKKKLLEHANKRVRPGTDNKIICSWNSSMISALVDAYTATGESKYLLLAEKTAYFIISNLIDKDDMSIYRVNNENIKIKGFLDDYANTVQAFLKLYSLTGDTVYFSYSESLTDYCMQNFLDPESQMFFYTQQSENDLFVRTKETDDNVIPSSNSVSAKNLLVLASLTNNTQKYQLAQNMLKNYQEKTYTNILYNSNWASAIMSQTQNRFEFIVCGHESQKIINEISKIYRPDTLFAQDYLNSEIQIFEGRQIDNETNIFICKNKVCNLPVKDFNQALKLLE